MGAVAVADEHEADADEADATHLEAEAIANQIVEVMGAQQKWLMACKHILTIPRMSDESASVADALDSLMITAAARAKRILRSDLDNG